MGMRLWTTRVGMFLGAGACLGLTASAAAESKRQRVGEIIVQRIKNSTENSMLEDGPRTRVPAPTKTAGVVVEVAVVAPREGGTREMDEGDDDGKDDVIGGDSEGLLLISDAIEVTVVEDDEGL